MLEHVALGQSRFMTPGVAPDPRGVVLGRYGMLAFPTLEGVVSWFRLYSAESSLDELIPGMQILRVRTPLRSREVLLRFPATSSYAMDRASRCAQLVGGATYTGTGKHFVKYRDDRSPYGYDATEITALPPGADLMLHGDDFTLTYETVGDIAFDRLLFRLSLRRIPGVDRLGPDERQELVLVIARGLGDGVIRYLWRNRVQGYVGIVRPQGESAFDDVNRPRSYLVARVRDLPPRILELFLGTPGIDVFRPVTSNVAVQVGFDHVISLASCTSVFEQESFYVFWGGRDRVDVVDGPLELSGLEHLTRIDIDLEQPDERDRLQLGDAEPVGVQIRLAPSLSTPRHVVGTLIPPNQAAWVKRLVYVMPQTILRGHRIAATDRGIVMVAESEIDVIPLGMLLAELAPGLLVPLGMDLVPRVAPDVLARALSHGAGLLTVFPHGATPFQIDDRALVPLERRALAKIEVARAAPIDASLEPLADPSLVNDPVGRFALWGFPAPEKKA